MKFFRKSLIAICIVWLLFFLYSPTALASNWYSTGRSGNFVFYRNNDFPHLHISMNDEDPCESHVTDELTTGNAYYYPSPRSRDHTSFNDVASASEAIRQYLTNAWNSFVSITYRPRNCPG